MRGAARRPPGGISGAARSGGRRRGRLVHRAAGRYTASGTSPVERMRSSASSSSTGTPRLSAF
ncbi:hypothetical protein, partial [Candidatus Collinsella stercoripullorum]|uniref:hypothetical protein n=1 Tax=Candidatus Collinsella stercoripullorum TaxID=2838522 RepID=UPI0022E35BFB